MREEGRPTALHEEHLRLGAKMVNFAGFAMPIQYPSGIRAEHLSVRRACGLFDVSHMGSVAIAGREALEFLLYLTTNDVARLEPGRAQYSALCREDGGVIDDVILYRLPDGTFLMVVNGTNRIRDLEWIDAHAGRFEVRIEDRTSTTVLLALQGPRAQEILQPLAAAELQDLGFYRALETEVVGVPAVVSRTGYSGEDGFELYLPSDRAAAVWRKLLESGAAAGLEPAGLGARDSLRLEMGYALHGNDLDQDWSPLESGLGWIVSLDKGPFIGRDSLVRQKEEGVKKTLTGIELTAPGFPRRGYPVLAGSEIIGEVTSGTVSPMLEKGIALARVEAGMAEPGRPVTVRIRDREIPGVIRKPPFYTGGSLKR